MFVVSNDFGEFGCAMYFLKANQWRTRPLVLVPSNSFNYSKEEIAPENHTEENYDCDIFEYESFKDVRHQFHKFKPDAIFLCSGYLLKFRRLQSTFATAYLLRIAARNRVRVFTTDPFLGLLSSSLSALQFGDIIRSGDSQFAALLAPFLSLLMNIRFRIASKILSKASHVYVGPIESNEKIKVRHSVYSFYNEAAFPPVDESEQELRSTAHIPPADRATWIFVLSRVDFALQTKDRGDAFYSALEQQFLTALTHNKKIVVIAPLQLQKQMSDRVLGHAHVQFVHDASYTEYQNYLFDAEYAFFWNIFSFSVIFRVLARKPVFFFDHGHVVRIFPEMLKAGVRTYYRNYEPPVLNIESRPDLEELTSLANISVAAFKKISFDYQQCPSPIGTATKSFASSNGQRNFWIVNSDNIVQ